jgi:ABC-type antimicrobial peptide transport system permease subunit
VPFIYLPLAQWPRFQTSMQVRADDRLADLAPLADQLHRAVRETHAGLRVFTAGSVREQAERSLAQERLLATLSTAFGLAALFLVCVGLYGVIAQWAEQRTAEIGVRVALGASRRGVLWMVLRQAFALVLAGVAVGLPAAMGASRLLETFLFGVRPMDPTTLALAALVMFAVAALAAYLPARRASRIDPMTALRHE